MMRLRRVERSQESALISTVLPLVEDDRRSVENREIGI